MGVKGTALFLETQYPRKTERQKEITDRSKEKAEAASHVELFAEVVRYEEDEKEGEVTSNGSQSQLAE